MAGQIFLRSTGRLRCFVQNLVSASMKTLDLFGDVVQAEEVPSVLRQWHRSTSRFGYGCHNGEDVRLSVLDECLRFSEESSKKGSVGHG